MKNLAMLLGVLALCSCSSPTSGTNNNTPGGNTTPDTYRIDFSASINLDGTPGLTTECYIYKNGWPTTLGSATFNSTALSVGLGSFIKNDWSTLPAPGDTLNYSCSDNGKSFSGQVSMPSSLSSIGLNQDGAPLSLTGTITIDRTKDLTVTWDTTPSTTSAGRVIGYFYGSYNQGVVVDYSAGTLTLPKSQFPPTTMTMFVYIEGFNFVVPTGDLVTPQNGSKLTAGQVKRYLLSFP